MMGIWNWNEESASEQGITGGGTSGMEPAAPQKAGRVRRQKKSSSYTEAKSKEIDRKPQEIATKVEGDLCKRDLPDDLTQRAIECMKLGQVWEYELVDPESDSDQDCELDPELEKYMDRLHPKRVPNWDIKKVSWEEHVVKMLHMVRLHEITEYDPVHCRPVLTRFCQFNMAYFDFDKESRAICGLPLRKLNSYEHNRLEESVNVVSLRILKSDVGYPIRVFGTVLTRDEVDYKCVYLFRRDKDNPQVINSPNDMLNLTDPCRGLAVANSMFFEINLKIMEDSGDTTVLSKGVIEHNTYLSDVTQIMEKSLTSWHSKVQLVYTLVPFAVQANLAVSILHRSCDFTGEVIAWTSKNPNKIILHDSKVAGTSTKLGAGGSVVLSRRLVAIPVDEKLVLRICIRDGARDEAACLELTLGHLDDYPTCYQEEYAVQVKVEWTAILDTMRRNVFHYVGETTVLI